MTTPEPGSLVGTHIEPPAGSGSGSPGGPPLLRLEGIRKRFGSVQALEGVDFDVYPNEIVALLGDNGAGKSTLIKIISGVYHPDEGSMYWNGKKTSFSSAREARSFGIEVTHQELALAEQLSVCRNIFLGKELEKRYLGGAIKLLDEKKMIEESAKLLAQLKINLPSPKVLVKFLSGGQRQSVAIGRCIYFNAKLIIMDEPTAALGVRESQAVLDLLQSLKRYTSIILITHNIRHALSVADRYFVLRHGTVIGSDRMANTDLVTIEDMMEKNIL
jgi:simple sugar transport system ATP-binding protein